MMYDPDGRDPAFEQMVLLGHSMGGLLSRTVAVASGDQFWRLYSDRPFDDILGAREVLDELRRYFFFEPLPFVSRVVFLATPHRGSDMSRGVVGRVGTSLISDPDHIHKLLYQLVKQNPDAFRPAAISPAADQHRDARARLADLDGPARTCSRRRLRTTIQFHSIIGSLRPDRASIGRPTAWFPGPAVASRRRRPEKIVRSDHGVQKDPEAIREVRRILREHVGVVQPPAVVQEARAPRSCAGGQAGIARRRAVKSLYLPPSLRNAQ